MQDKKQEKLEAKVDWPEVSEEVKQMFSIDTGEYDPNVLKHSWQDPRSSDYEPGRNRMPDSIAKYILTGIAGKITQENQNHQ